MLGRPEGPSIMALRDWPGPGKIVSSSYHLVERDSDEGAGRALVRARREAREGRRVLENILRVSFSKCLASFLLGNGCWFRTVSRAKRHIYIERTLKNGPAPGQMALF